MTVLTYCCCCSTCPSVTLFLSISHLTLFTFLSLPHTRRMMFLTFCGKSDPSLLTLHPLASPAQSLVIERELEDVAVTAPDQACFQCEVSVAISRPPVWTLNGETIQSSPDVRLENHGTVHKLNLKQTRPDMSGTVTFAMGKAKSSAKLNVMWK